LAFASQADGSSFAAATPGCSQAFNRDYIFFSREIFSSLRISLQISLLFSEYTHILYFLFREFHIESRASFIEFLREDLYFFSESFLF